jgi:hypothetical protein
MFGAKARLTIEDATKVMAKLAAAYPAPPRNAAAIRASPKIAPRTIDPTITVP